MPGRDRQIRPARGDQAADMESRVSPAEDSSHENRDVGDSVRGGVAFYRGIVAPAAGYRRGSCGSAASMYAQMIVARQSTGGAYSATSHLDRWSQCECPSAWPATDET